MAISPPIIRPIKKRSFHNCPPDKGWHCVTPRKNGPSKPAIPAIFPSTMYDSAADNPIIIPPIADSTGVNMMLLVVSLVSSTRLSFWKFWATGSQSSDIFCTSIKTGINMLFYFQSHKRSLWFSFQDSNGKPSRKYPWCDFASFPVEICPRDQVLSNKTCGFPSN